MKRRIGERKRLFWTAPSGRYRRRARMPGLSNAGRGAIPVAIVRVRGAMHLQGTCTRCVSCAYRYRPRCSGRGRAGDSLKRLEAGKQHTRRQPREAGTPDDPIQPTSKSIYCKRRRTTTKPNTAKAALFFSVARAQRRSGNQDRKTRAEQFLISCLDIDLTLIFSGDSCSDLNDRFQKR